VAVPQGPERPAWQQGHGIDAGERGREPGRILAKLDELGIANDTIVVFTSDNGGSVLRNRHGVSPTSNAPLRAGKASLYEGGTRVPLVISWPGVTAPGSVSATVTSSVDLYPTFLEAAGAAPPAGQRLDGTSLAPVLGGRGELEREAIFCHRPNYGRFISARPGTYVRKGPWKLIRFYGAGKNQTDTYEFYNLDEDLGGEHDLAAKMPERVATLAALIDEHLDETRALLPIRNPSYDPMSEALRRRKQAQRAR
jgi:arylsulfatase A-like enzyme